ncbi:MAG: hypothetical protein ACYTHJ_01080 [Planctomycetota bacterium]|jgi:hypothetical protein
MDSDENKNEPVENDSLDPAPTGSSDSGDPVESDHVEVEHSGHEQAGGVQPSGDDATGAIEDEPAPGTPAADKPVATEEPPPVTGNYEDVDDETEPAGDTDSIDDSEVETRSTDESGARLDWEHETSVRHIAVELKHIEKEVREILDSLDTRRKRRLTGSRRWLDLEEDMINWQFGGKFDNRTLARLRELITRRNHLFTRLKFLAGTRPTWNT